LDEGAARIAVEEHPGATVDDVLRGLDRLASAAHVRGQDGFYGIARLVHHLFEEEGFKGDVEDYDHPLNSCLDAVLQRKKGLPIVLSVLTVEVGRRAGILLDPVGYPGHFLVGTRNTTPRFFLDPFRRGAIRRQDELEMELAEGLGRPAEMPEIQRALAPTAPRDVLLRISTNLVRTWMRRGNMTGALRNADRRVALRPDLPEVRRDRGLLRARLGMRRDAVDDLQGYLVERPDAEDAPRVSWQLSMLLRQP
jgi:regulator of sirC expression with transglutaminase-like and TPR domain